MSLLPRAALFLCLATPLFAETPGCFQVLPDQEPEAALAACGALLEQPDISPSIRAGALVEQGIALRALGRFDDSITHIEQALALTPQDTSALRMLAWTYREMGRLEEAEAMYTRVLDLDTHWQGWLSRCAVRTDLGRHAEALSDCNAAARQTVNADIRYFKGLALLNLGRDQDAYQAVAPGLDSPDLNGRLYQVAAVALWNSGQQDKALRLAQTGLQTYPKDPDILWFLSQVGSN